MHENSAAQKPISTNLLDFLICYENTAANIQHPVDKVNYEKALAGKYEYVEWTGVVIRIEDVTELGNRPEEYYIDVYDKDTVRTPKNNLVGFTAYFNHLSKDDYAKFRIDQKITIRGKIDTRNKFLNKWILKESKII